MISDRDSLILSFRSMMAELEEAEPNFEEVLYTLFATCAEYSIQIGIEFPPGPYIASLNQVRLGSFESLDAAIEALVENGIDNIFALLERSPLDMRILN